MRIRVNVTRELIQQANELRNQDRSKCCPVALALKGRYPDLTVETTYFNGTDRTGRQVKAALTGIAKAFIRRFDDGKRVRPFRTVLTGKVVFTPAVPTEAPAQA